MKEKDWWQVDLSIKINGEEAKLDELKDGDLASIADGIRNRKLEGKLTLPKNPLASSEE